MVGVASHPIIIGGLVFDARSSVVKCHIPFRSWHDYLYTVHTHTYIYKYIMCMQLRTSHVFSVLGPSLIITDCTSWQVNLFYWVYIPDQDILQGYFRLCDWLSLRCLVPWIKYLPSACRSIFDYPILNRSVWKFDKMKNELYLLYEYMYIGSNHQMLSNIVVKNKCTGTLLCFWFLSCTIAKVYGFTLPLMLDNRIIIENDYFTTWYTYAIQRVSYHKTPGFIL